ncbi:class Ib ribonucleoside-diphosphate reductase assembly flavoprotein NrdI, partial [Streptococcus anginosus]|nr:class Ib ribonucleoside-diphosphate reductase assembly flavoprotein NrdI [Streptococcus anginosus]
DEPYVLICPTYGGGNHRGAVPRPVIKFLNNEHNRALIRGVIAGGNTNFGDVYGLAGDVIAEKCGVPMMYRFELLGTPTDVATVKEGLEQFWATQH